MIIVCLWTTKAEKIVVFQNLNPAHFTFKDFLMLKILGQSYSRIMHNSLIYRHVRDMRALSLWMYARMCHRKTPPLSIQKTPPLCKAHWKDTLPFITFSSKIPHICPKTLTPGYNLALWAACELKYHQRPSVSSQSPYDSPQTLSICHMKDSLCEQNSPKRTPFWPLGRILWWQTPVIFWRSALPGGKSS